MTIKIKPSTQTNYEQIFSHDNPPTLRKKNYSQNSIFKLNSKEIMSLLNNLVKSILIRGAPGVLATCQLHHQCRSVDQANLKIYAVDKRTNRIVHVRFYLNRELASFYLLLSASMCAR